MARRADLSHLLGELDALITALHTAAAERADDIAGVHPTHRESARNLIHYVELRRHDIRTLQSRLADLGLSSLGRSEAHVLRSVEAVRDLLHALTDPAHRAALHVGDHAAPALDRNANALLGRSPRPRSTRIMVTLPSESAADGTIIGDLVDAGMDVARVNCAHDDVTAWAAMVDELRRRERVDGSRCTIAMDLAGPKLRTGPLQPGPHVLRVAPTRDDAGNVTAAGLAWLTPAGSAASAPTPDGALATIIPITDATWLTARKIGDRLQFVDARGAKRVWRVVEVHDGGLLAAVRATSYVHTGAEISCADQPGVGCSTIGELPAIERSYRVHRGDTVVLTNSVEPPQSAGSATTHEIGCTLPEAFLAVREGHRVWFDDGKIGGVVQRADAASIRVLVTDVRARGANLKAGKGINLPDTSLPVAALTPKDLEDLPFVAQHADVVNLSFVRSVRDVRHLQAELHLLAADHLGIVLKIETADGFAQLPALLLAAMRTERVGVMIARGDLAVEVGFDRMAEVQEEIMWICEAAHVPVIWATQVLDSLARTGHPSRAEVTDAAMAVRAECVMLNKGPHIVEAITALDSILVRMQTHHHKKRSLLRRLRAWDVSTPSTDPVENAHRRRPKATPVVQER